VLQRFHREADAEARKASLKRASRSGMCNPLCGAPSWGVIWSLRAQRRSNDTRPTGLAADCARQCKIKDSTSGFAQEGSSAGVMPANAGIQGAGRNGFPLSRE